VTSSIHPTAIVDTDALGEGCTVLEYASLGAEVSLEPGVSVGSGARLLGAVNVGEDATIGPNAVLGPFDGDVEGAIALGRGVQIGANATVRPGVAIGRGAVVEAGSVVDVDVPAYAVVRGSPAHIVGYVDSLPEVSAPDVVDPSEPMAEAEIRVPGVTLQRATTARDLRGSLAALELSELPFLPQRVFAVYGVPSESVRGAHAHRTCGQVLFCMAGEVRCVADDGSNRQEFRLAGPEVGIYIPPMVWSMQYRYTGNAVLVVLAQLPYDPDDYIRDYEEFLTLVGAR
jgi:serine acetyltransferase/dTDP-4-dehydrorhamnose 3,5-epimerase-like enzyme